MSAATHARDLRLRDARPERGRLAEPAWPSDAEREFWRREVAIERARQGRARPAPFPFQER